VTRKKKVVAKRKPKEKAKMVPTDSPAIHTRSKIKMIECSSPSMRT
jgi:hypothetical protein